MTNKNKCVSEKCHNRADYNFTNADEKYFCYEHYMLIKSLANYRTTKKGNYLSEA
jgi:hypothetical protein